jgi:DnaK suppressor protein
MAKLNHLTAAQLRDLRAELEHDLARLERATATETAWTAGPPPLPREADPFEHGGIAVALQGRALTRHIEVTEALDRLANGDYGLCTRCGNPIPYGRLMIMPETAYCVSCGATG